MAKYLNGIRCQTATKKTDEKPTPALKTNSYYEEPFTLSTLKKACVHRPFFFLYRQLTRFVLL